MQKHIAYHDISDMMVQEGMHAQSLRFHFKESAVYAVSVKVASSVYSFFERGVRAFKQLVRKTRVTVQPKLVILDSTTRVFYSISVMSIAISFFWVMLLLRV